jgi:two-component system sensor kinase FixL
MTIVHAVVAAARVIALLMVVRHVARARGALASGDTQFRKAVELLPFATLVTDPRGRILLANAATAGLFGYTRSALIGACAGMLLPASPGRYARRKDGTEFPAEITSRRISSGAASETLTVVVDRSDRYELLRNREALAHLARVSTLGELAGSLAHELNQPLTAILSNAQAAQRFMATQPIDLAEVREILDDLVKDNHRASDVLRRIRVLVKKGEIEAAALSLASVVGDVALLVHGDAIARGIRMSLNVSPQLPSVYGDKVQLQQVMLNLLLNAFEALASRAAHDRVVMIEARPDGAEMVRVAVRDRGVGLSSDKIDKLFIPYFTSKREGLGLGLSISRSIVEMHGGRIWAENNADQGAAFYFTLPTGAAAGYARSRLQP